MSVDCAEIYDEKEDKSMPREFLLDRNMYIQYRYTLEYTKLSERGRDIKRGLDEIYEKGLLMRPVSTMVCGWRYS